MIVAVAGAAGQLGAALVDAFRDHDVTALTHAQLDITDRAAVARVMDALRPDLIVNGAAYNDVDGAEREPSAALELNALALLPLADAATRHGAALVHFGTDFVFDGESDRPYVETDRVRPRNTYGCSKLLGEMFAATTARHYVLRVESLFGGPTAGVTARAGALGNMVAKMRKGEEIAVFVDRTVSPTFAPDVAAAVRAAIERDLPPGLYHCVNSGAASWETIAREAAAVLGIDARLRPVTLEALSLPAIRPKYCALDPSKLAAHGIRMRPWEQAVRAWLAR